MKKIKVLYLFRRSVKKNMALANKEIFPHDYFFGYTKLSKSFKKNVSDRILENKILWGLEIYFIRLVLPFTRVGFSLFSIFRHFSDIRKADVVFATADTYGLPLGLLKLCIFRTKSIVLYTGGVCDAIVESRSKLYRAFCRHSLKNISLVITGLDSEGAKLSSILSLPRNKFLRVPYGIDTEYFSPGQSDNKGNYVLAVGADYKRDWNLHKKAAQALRNTEFVFITTPDSVKVNMPKNVKIRYNLSIDEVRDYIRNSRALLALSKQNYRFAGQSTIFRAMACAKPVIFTKSSGVDGYPGLENFRNCIMVPPSDSASVVKAIKYLSADQNRSEKMGKSARKFILSFSDYKTYTKNLEKVFKLSLKVHA